MVRTATVTLLAALALGSLSRAADAPAPDRADVHELVQGNTAFALDLYARLAETEGNLFVSPYSISTALGMTYGGARGATADEMAKTLHFTLDQKRLHPAFAELTRTLNGHGLPRDYQLHVANALWPARGMSLKPDFLKLVKDHYGSRIRAVDFAEAREEARQQINRWVEMQTNDKVKELLHKDDLNADVRLVLTNAIYFQAAWRSPFDKEDTRPADFHVAANRTVKAEMMRQMGKFKYFSNDALEALELPYEGGELALLVLLPHKEDGLAQLEKALTPKDLEAWVGKLKAEMVDVQLPKFKVASRFSLGDQLQALGMKQAFSSGADFSGMAGERLMIAKVIHQAYIDLNEEGTEAAGATAVLFGRGSAEVKFRADHPFVFLIRDTRTGSILFLGRVTEPQAKR
jgi:serpin B